jgi:hypothetical protein
VSFVWGSVKGEKRWLREEGAVAVAASHFLWRRKGGALAHGRSARRVAGAAGLGLTWTGPDGRLGFRGSGVLEWRNFGGFGSIGIIPIKPFGTHDFMGNFL